ncbi:MAG: LrgB family protein [Burkholderiales bacterium]|jgi:putative effector of murein hydrolase
MSPQLPEIREIWVYLSGSPLLALTLTLAAWELGTLAYEKSGRNPLVNPVAIAVAAVAATIVAIGMPYATYFEGAQFVHFLLGTATVALAVPIHRGLDALRGRVVPLVAALLGGGTVSIATALGAARLFGVDAPLQQGLWAKSVTAPIAMGVAERIGASPTLTAVYAVVTGVLGAALGRFVLDAVGCRAWWQRGAAIGIAAHGIGTSRAFNVHPEAGAWASLAMGLHGVIGAVLIPLVLGR